MRMVARRDVGLGCAAEPHAGSVAKLCVKYISRVGVCLTPKIFVMLFTREESGLLLRSRVVRWFSYDKYLNVKVSISEKEDGEG